MRSYVSDCPGVQYWRGLVHVPNMEDVGVSSLNGLAPLISCHIEAHRRDRSRLDFNEPVRNAALIVIIGKHVVTCEVIIKTWPFGFQTYTDVFKALALMIKRKDFRSAPLLHLFVIREEARIA